MSSIFTYYPMFILIAARSALVRIAYVSLATPFSQGSWSGIPWATLQEVKRRFPDTHVIDTPRIDKVVQRLAAVERFDVNVLRNVLLSKYFTTYVNSQIEMIKPDAIVAVSAAHKIAYADINVPLIYVSDALYGNVVNYYEKYASNSKRWKNKGDELQRSLIGRVTKFLLSSQWAVDSAAKYYDISAEKLVVAPMGANLSVTPVFVPPVMNRPISLLFVGYHWLRKGGPLIVEIWRELRRRTGSAELHIVGAMPEDLASIPGVFLHGKLNKADPVDYQRFTQLYRDAHFFIMPSRQEAYGIAFCEAAAFGRPVVATDTGGVATIVQDGRSGLLCTLEATAQDYAVRILQLWSDPAAYLDMCLVARQRFEQTLNWQAWGQTLEDTIIEEVKRQKAPSLQEASMAL